MTTSTTITRSRDTNLRRLTDLVLGPYILGPWSAFGSWSLVKSDVLGNPLRHAPCSVAGMAGVYRFEDLRVWQASRDQCRRVGGLVSRPQFRRDPELSGQMNGASISVMFNISEGFLRRSDPDTLKFLRYSLASNGELKSGYYAAEDRKYITPSEVKELIDLNESIAKMLDKWKATLKPARRTGSRRRT